MAKNKTKDNEDQKIVRLSIQISNKQMHLLNSFVVSRFEETGIIINTSQVVREALSKYLQENKN